MRFEAENNPRPNSTTNQVKLAEQNCNAFSVLFSRFRK